MGFIMLECRPLAMVDTMCFIVVSCHLCWKYSNNSFHIWQSHQFNRYVRPMMIDRYDKVRHWHFIRVSLPVFTLIFYSGDQHNLTNLWKETFPTFISNSRFRNRNVRHIQIDSELLASPEWDLFPVFQFCFVFFLFHSWASVLASLSFFTSRTLPYNE